MNVGAEQQSGGRTIKLDLHIGTEKTGTTSFQHWLKDAQSKLEVEGVICPVWPKRFESNSDNRMLSVLAQGFKPEDDAQAKLGFTTKTRYAELCDDFRQAFAEEIKHRSQGRWIISGEHMQSRLVDVEQVRRLADFLQPFFSEIVIHIHLRPQVDVARSFFSTLTRMGAKVTENKIRSINADNPYYNYASLVARWEAVFGQAQVRLIPYKRARSIRDYFLDLWQLDAADFNREFKINRAVDWRSIALVNAIQPHRPAIPINLGLQKAIGALPVRDTLQLGLARAQDITARMLPSNQALVAARSELTIDDLTPNWDDYDHPENFSRINLACDFAAEAAGLIGELQAELILEKARTAVLQAENFHFVGKTARAKAKLEHANQLMLTIEPMWRNRDSFVQLQNYLAKVVLDGLS